MSQDQILSILRKSKKPLTHHQIASISKIAPSSAQINLAKLLEKNLIEKIKIKADNQYIRYFFHKKPILVKSKKIVSFFKIKELCGNLRTATKPLGYNRLG